MTERRNQRHWTMYQSASFVRNHAVKKYGEQLVRKSEKITGTRNYIPSGLSKCSNSLPGLDGENEDIYPVCFYEIESVHIRKVLSHYCQHTDDAMVKCMLFLN